MKYVLLFLVALVSVGLCLFTKKRVTITEDASSPDTINFKTQVEPILQHNCSPCHFPGGKMYKKMPFDMGQTLLSHEAGIFKRIKNPKEKNIIQQYIRENKKAVDP